MAAMVDWRDNVFVICTSPGSSEKMLELCCVYLLPRTDILPTQKNVFCDKVGEHLADSPLTHLTYSEDQHMWILEQRATPYGRDEVLATCSVIDRYPNGGDQWQLVHESFGGKGSLRLDMWTMQYYEKKMKYMPTSDTSALSLVMKLSRELKEVLYMP